MDLAEGGVLTTTATAVSTTATQEPAVARRKWRRSVLLVLIVMSGVGQCQLPVLLKSGNPERDDWRNSAEFQRS
jgi:hypothetical protein